MVQIHRDEEVVQDPYLVVRFTWTSDGESIRGMQWQALVNDGHLTQEEIRLRVLGWLQHTANDEFYEELIDEAREVLVLENADQVLDRMKEDGW